jgi:acyl-CoA thioesterase-1
MSTQRIKHLLILLGAVCLSFNVAAKEILVYGDSLSAGYGINLEEGWVHLLGQRLAPDHTVINASISGETTTGGLARLPATLDEFDPDIVLLELGANDGLRGQQTRLIEDNLRTMVRQIRDHGAQVVVFGITLPPSYGPRYIDQFRDVFRKVASSEESLYYDLVVEGFIGDSNYIQADGLHPTALAQPEIEQLIFEFLQDSGILDDSLQATD